MWLAMGCVLSLFTLSFSFSLSLFFSLVFPFSLLSHSRAPETDVAPTCAQLWDVCTDQEAVDLIKDCKEPQEASQKLLTHALDSFSTDNLSCLVVVRLPSSHSPCSPTTSNAVFLEKNRNSTSKLAPPAHPLCTSSSPSSTPSHISHSPRKQFPPSLSSIFDLLRPRSPALFSLSPSIRSTFLLPVGMQFSLFPSLSLSFSPTQQKQCKVSFTNHSFSRSRNDPA